MSYFPPYLDSTGVHLPTYEDRLSQLISDYRSIFGPDILLTEDTMDYQLLSLFAKSLDDLSSLILDAYTSRNPDFATGQSLDLLLPLNGIHRLPATETAPAETDAQVRLRRSLAVTAPSLTLGESIVNAVKLLPNVTYCRLFENDTDTTDDRGFPPHSITVLVRGGTNTEIARTIFNKKSPGITTNGTTSVTVTDPYDQPHTIHFTKAADAPATVRVTVTPLTGWDSETMVPVIKQAVVNYISKLQVGESLIIPALYGPIFEAIGSYPFTINAINVSAAGQSSTTLITPAYYQQLTTTSLLVTVVEAT